MVGDDSDILFPPQPDNEHEWSALERVLSCAVEGREAQYVSTPITSGTRFIDWYREHGCQLDPASDDYKRSRHQHVIGPNRLHARQLVERLRAEHRIVIEPTSLTVGHWTQSDYRHLWGRVIEHYAQRVWLVDGWQYSSGCAYEFYVASRSGIETVDESGRFVSRRKGANLIASAISEIEAIGQSAEFLKAVAAALVEVRNVEVEVLTKDETLDRLANSHNVAQFVSFTAGDTSTQRFCRILGVPNGYKFTSVDEAIALLLKNATDRSVNVRSFRPDDLGSYPFEYGLKSVAEAAECVRRLARDGLYTIVNETIDVHDGGVSGVLADNFVEFAPDDTPRCVERPGTARLPIDVAETILQSVYDFRPEWDREPTRRVEFSLHPQKRGVRRDHTIIWEVGSLGVGWAAPRTAGNLQVGPWPNRFSRMLGDKTYGLLIAHALGLPVPSTTVFNMRVAPFTFGQATSGEGWWLRTAPAVNEPGRYPTRHIAGRAPQTSPDSLASLETVLREFAEHEPLLEWAGLAVLEQRGFSSPWPAAIVPEGASSRAAPPSPGTLPSVLAQQSVRAQWSGSLVTEAAGPRVEGVSGFGDRFMMNERRSEALPESVGAAVLEIHRQASELLGPISMEWAFDGTTVWVIQLHQELSSGVGSVIVPGEASRWHTFDPSQGLTALRELAELAAQRNEGIELTASIAATSHGAAILRRKKVPARVRDR